MRNGTLFEEIYEGLINDSHNLTVEKDGNEYIQKRKFLRDKQSLEIKQLNQKHRLQLHALKRKHSNKLNAIRKKHSNQLRNIYLKSV